MSGVCWVCFAGMDCIMFRTSETICCLHCIGFLQAKTHEKVDSIGEERSIGCHAVIMLIRKDMA
jgi:2C-methyl-D-erythritol 2,4-cyclodiphosphate synthase